MTNSQPAARLCSWINEAIMRSPAWLAGNDRSPCWIKDLATSQAWAIAAPGNLLDPADPIGSPEGVTRVIEQAHEVAERLGVAWSGRLLLWTGSGAAFGEDSHDDFFARSLATWGPVALTHFQSVVDRLAAVADHLGVRLLFRPHARHVLPDPQRCLTFLRDRADAPISLLIDPGAMLERSMLPTADDHLDRILSALAPLADGIALTGPAGDPGAGISQDTIEAPPMDIVSIEQSTCDQARTRAALQRALHEALAVVAVSPDPASAFRAVSLIG